MDIYRAIRELHQEKEKLDHVIASLEELQRTASPLKELAVVKRRGRKSMSMEERRIVSERMKKYWAKRRNSMVKQWSAESNG